MPYKNLEKSKQYYLEYKKEWNKRNPEKVKEYTNRYNTKNKEKVLEKSRIAMKERYRINPEKIKEINKRSYLKHIEKRRQEGRDKYTKNPEKAKQRALEWGKKNPKKKSRIMVFQNAKRRSRKLGNGGSGFSIDDWKKVKEYFGNKCAYCGKESDRLSIDHFIPICRGGMDDASNILPACLGCNVSKGKKDPFTWVNSGEAIEVIKEWFKERGVKP